MANLKIVLRKEVKKDGTSPLAIRITKDRKSSYIYLEYSVKSSDWDKVNQRIKKSHPNSVRLNNYLLKKLAEVTEKALELESTQDRVSSQAVRKKVKPAAQSSVFAQADLYIDRLKEDGKYNRHSADKPRVKRLKEFLKQDVHFSELSIPLIERYKAWLKSNHKMSERTAVNHLVILRSIFSQAIDEQACDPKYYPFGKGKIVIKFPDSQKLGLTIEEVQRLETSKLEKKSDHVRNLWLISFYFAGMRVSDVLRLTWSDIRDGRLFYIMGKNTKGDSLKISDKAARIFKKYKTLRVPGDNLIFEELRGVNLNDTYEAQRIIASRTNVIDKRLRLKVAPACEIDKKLTMHIARHTFGNLSGDKIPIQMLQKLYRHSSITTTIGYQSNFIHKETDDALDSVLNF